MGSAGTGSTQRLSTASSIRRQACSAKVGFRVPQDSLKVLDCQIPDESVCAQLLCCSVIVFLQLTFLWRGFRQIFGGSCLHFSWRMHCRFVHRIMIIKTQLVATMMVCHSYHIGRIAAPIMHSWRRCPSDDDFGDGTNVCPGITSFSRKCWLLCRKVRSSHRANNCPDFPNPLNSGMFPKSEPEFLYDLRSSY